MRKALIFIIKILSLVLLVLLLIYLFQTTRAFGYQAFSDKAKDQKSSPHVVETVVHIGEGESLKAIAQDLENKKIIENKWTFALALRCMEGYDSIVPGDYTLNSSMKPSQILDKIAHREETQ